MLQIQEHNGDFLLSY